MESFTSKKARQQLKTKPSTPKEHPFQRVVIREELCALTKNHEDAVLLGQLIFWQDKTGDTDEYLKEEVGRLSEPNDNLQFGWIYKAADKLAKEVMLDLAEDAVRRRLKKFVEKGWIEERKNPVFKYDQKRQYRVNLLGVNAQIRDLKNEDGTNAGYYLSCDLMDTALTYIPRSSGMESAPQRVVQSALERDDVETKQNKNREEKIFGQNSSSSSNISPMPNSAANCNTNPSLLRTKEELRMDAERSYDSFKSKYRNDAMLRDIDYKRFKSAELQAERTNLEVKGVAADDARKAVDNLAACLESFDDQIVALINEKKAKWLVRRRDAYINEFIARRCSPADTIKSVFPDHDKQYWFARAIGKIQEERNKAEVSKISSVSVESDTSSTLDSAADCDTSSSLLRTKDEVRLAAEGALAGFVASFENAELATAEEYEAFKRGDLKNRLADMAEAYETLDAEMLSIVNSKKERGIACVKEQYVKHIIERGEEDLEAAKLAADEFGSCCRVFKSNESYFAELTRKAEMEAIKREMALEYQKYREQRESEVSLEVDEDNLQEVAPEKYASSLYSKYALNLYSKEKQEEEILRKASEICERQVTEPTMREMSHVSSKLDEVRSGLEEKREKHSCAVKRGYIR